MGNKTCKYLLDADFLLDLVFSPENGSDIFLRNVG
jgi:hypothetical protein